MKQKNNHVDYFVHTTTLSHYMENPQTVIHKIVSIWQENFSNHPEHHNMEWLTANNSVLSQIPQSNLMTVIFSYADLSIFHINQAAADYFGYTVEEIRNEGASLIISCFDDEPMKFMIDAAQLSANEFAHGNFKNLLNSSFCFNNWVINNRQGFKHRALLRVFPIELNEQGLPLTGMYLIHDINPFVKGNIWWYRSVIGEKSFSYYQSEEGKFQQKDILSNREKSVLKLLATGLSSKEIGAQLHVSSHTIDNHRRRMLARTGAVDTSALIHIANLNGLL